MSAEGNLIRDARERWVPQFEPPHSRHALQELIGAQAFSRVDAQLALHVRRRMLAVFAWIAGVTLVLGCAGVVLMLPGTSGTVVLLYLGMLGTVVWIVRWRRSRSPLRLLDSFARRDTLLAAGLCASCAYSIDGIPPAPDGCAVCPECGAAWKLPHPATTTSPPHTTTSTGFPPNS